MPCALLHVHGRKKTANPKVGGLIFQW